MTDILIKSFNRPFYLERCIKSIKNFVLGDYKISVLDDGTPKKYLNKIEEKHPDINIITSESYMIKTKAIAENLEYGKEINGFQIPTELWKNAVKNASEYFIITEDDVWFTHEINVDELSKKAKYHHIALLKLGWLGNTKDEEEVDIYPIDHQLHAIKPKELFLSHPIIMDWFFYNKFKFFSLAYKLKIFDNNTKLKYWALNSILMGFWQKDYWLAIWKDSKGIVDEKQQLRNAANYYKKHQQNPNFIVKLSHEAMRTTFQSSSTNSYHKYGYEFDVNLFNHLINEAWFDDKFNAMENFPKDFSSTYFEEFISDKINLDEYRKWVQQFKNQYKNLGCNVE